MSSEKAVIPNQVRDPGFPRDYAFARVLWGGAVLQHHHKMPHEMRVIAPEVPQFFSFGRSQVSTIFVGSIASLSTCSSRIFPSFPIKKFTLRAALYLST
jgi:hypothetical protein